MYIQKWTQGKDFRALQAFDRGALCWTKLLLMNTLVPKNSTRGTTGLLKRFCVKGPEFKISRPEHQNSKPYTDP